MVFVNRKDISAKCIFAAVSSLFLTDSSHFYLQEPLLVLCLVPRRKGAPGSGSEAGTQRQTCAEGRCRDGLQHLTVHKHRRAFVDFSQNAPVKHATNRGKKKKRVKDRQNRSLLPAETLASILQDQAPLCPQHWGATHTVGRAVSFANAHPRSAMVASSPPDCSSSLALFFLPPPPKPGDQG